MLGLGPPELIIIAIVVLALFGYKKLPDAARAVGRSARILKAETKGLRGEPRAGRHEAGPLIFELPETTLVLPPAWSAEVDEAGTIVATREHPEDG